MLKFRFDRCIKVWQSSHSRFRRDDSRNLCDTDCMTAHTQLLQQEDFAQELPKMDFQDYFVELIVGNIKSPKVFTKENR